VGKPEGKVQLGRPRRKCEDNIKMDLQKVGCRGIEWIKLAHQQMHIYIYIYIYIHVHLLVQIINKSY
jgi:hypothetical protein